MTKSKQKAQRQKFKNSFSFKSRGVNDDWRDMSAAGPWLASLAKEAKQEEARWASWENTIRAITKSTSMLLTERVNLWTNPIPAWLPHHMHYEARKTLKAHLHLGAEQRPPVEACRVIYAGPEGRKTLGTYLTKPAVRPIAVE